MKAHLDREAPDRSAGKEGGHTIYDPPNASRFLQGITEKTLANWRCEGNGPKFVKIGGKVAYFEKDLIAFLESRRFSSTSDYAARSTKRKRKKRPASESSTPSVATAETGA